MQWVGHTHFARLSAGTALRAYPQLMEATSPNPPMVAGDLLFIAPPNGAYLRTDVLETSDDKAVLRDPDGNYWRMRHRRAGELATDIRLVGEFQDWIVEGVINCPDKHPGAST